MQGIILFIFNLFHCLATMKTLSLLRAFNSCFVMEWKPLLKVTTCILQSDVFNKLYQKLSMKTLYNLCLEIDPQKHILHLKKIYKGADIKLSADAGSMQQINIIQNALKGVKAEIYSLLAQFSMEEVELQKSRSATNIFKKLSYHQNLINTLITTKKKQMLAKTRSKIKQPLLQSEHSLQNKIKAFETEISCFRADFKLRFKDIKKQYKTISFTYKNEGDREFKGSYIGQMRDDMPHGLGVFSWYNWRIQAEWDEGIIHGYGVEYKNDKIESEYHKRQGVVDGIRIDYLHKGIKSIQYWKEGEIELKKQEDTLKARTCSEGKFYK